MVLPEFSIAHWCHQDIVALSKFQGLPKTSRVTPGARLQDSIFNLGSSFSGTSVRIPRGEDHAAASESQRLSLEHGFKISYGFRPQLLQNLSRDSHGLLRTTATESQALTLEQGFKP